MVDITDITALSESVINAISSSPNTSETFDLCKKYINETNTIECYTEGLGKIIPIFNWSIDPEYSDDETRKILKALLVTSIEKTVCSLEALKQYEQQVIYRNCSAEFRKVIQSAFMEKKFGLIFDVCKAGEGITDNDISDLLACVDNKEIFVGPMLKIRAFNILRTRVAFDKFHSVGKDQSIVQTLFYDLLNDIKKGDFTLEQLEGFKKAIAFELPGTNYDTETGSCLKDAFNQAIDDKINALRRSHVNGNEGSGKTQETHSMRASYNNPVICCGIGIGILAPLVTYCTKGFGGLGAVASAGIIIACGGVGGFVSFAISSAIDEKPAKKNN